MQFELSGQDQISLYSTLSVTFIFIYGVSAGPRVGQLSRIPFELHEFKNVFFAHHFDKLQFPNYELIIKKKIKNDKTNNYFISEYAATPWAGSDSSLHPAPKPIFMCPLRCGLALRFRDFARNRITDFV